MTHLSTSRGDGVVLVRLENPERRNALTPTLCDAILDAVGDAEADPAIGALVIAAAGPAFSSGGDLELLERAAADPLTDEALEELGRIYRLFGALASAAIPTVAAVGGAVVGAGANLALACDLRIVADDLKLRGFAGAGIHPGGGHIRMLLKEMGPGAAAAVALFDEAVDAEMALRCGFAWRIVPREQLEAEAMGLAARAARDPALTRAAVATYRATLASELTPDSATQLERVAQLWSLRRWAAQRRSR